MRARRPRPRCVARMWDCFACEEMVGTEGAEKVLDKCGWRRGLSKEGKAELLEALRYRRPEDCRDKQGNVIVEHKD